MQRRSTISLMLTTTGLACLGTSQALILYRKAVERGDVSAQLRLGDLYFLGQGVPKDLDQAEHWYSQAAKQGNVWSKQQMSKIHKERDPAAWEREQARFAEEQPQHLDIDKRTIKSRPNFPESAA